MQAPEPLLEQITAKFFRDRIFTPGRAGLLAAQLPATDTDAAARRDTAAATRQATIRKRDAQQNGQITALEDIPADPADTAAAAMRARIRERFAQLHTQRTQAEGDLAALTATQPPRSRPRHPRRPEIPYAGDILPGLPPALKARFFAAFDITLLWNKPGGQVTVTAVITDATLNALPELLNPRQPGYHDTNTPAGAGDTTAAGPATVGHSAQPPIAVWMGHSCHAVIWLT